MALVKSSDLISVVFVDSTAADVVHKSYQNGFVNPAPLCEVSQGLFLARKKVYNRRYICAKMRYCHCVNSSGGRITGPFLLTNQLTDYMIQTAALAHECRIINVTCAAHDHLTSRSTRSM